MDARQLHFSRRGFLKATAALGGGLAAGMTVLPAWGLEAGGKGGAGLKDLPEGSAPPPVPLPHFPDRLHAFVWRNWSLVPVCRLARVVGARDSDIVRLGRAMGLGEPPAISRDQQIRARLTVLRRNWHLLPYEQLLELLGWTPERLAFALREDDFLYIKLGSLKPRCQPLRYQPPDETARKREAEIAGVLREEFGPELAAPHEPLFSFVARLSSRPPAPASAAPTPANLRFCYSYFALYGDPLLDEETDPYPEGYLERLAQIGVNGVWLQALLHKLAPSPGNRAERAIPNAPAPLAAARRRARAWHGRIPLPERTARDAAGVLRESARNSRACRGRLRGALHQRAGGATVPAQFRGGHLPGGA